MIKRTEPAQRKSQIKDMQASIEQIKGGRAKYGGMTSQSARTQSNRHNSRSVWRSAILVMPCVAACVLLCEGQHATRLAEDMGLDGPVHIGRFPASQPTTDRDCDLDLGNDVHLPCVLIPAGRFTMGSKLGSDERPEHEITISREFYMGKYEVTQQQWKQVMMKNRSCFANDTFPVETVNWMDAVEFCQRVTKQVGRTVRLPTEAEWEYACRANTRTHFNMGEVISTDDANYHGHYVCEGGRKGEYRAKTRGVGSFAPNGFGLYDMHGNVAEWCSDWYGKDYYKESPRMDPSGPLKGTERVVPGGAWAWHPTMCRSAARDAHTPQSAAPDTGFRIVVEARAVQ